MIVNDVNVVNYDNVVVFVIEKNLLMVDLCCFYIILF